MVVGDASTAKTAQPVYDKRGKKGKGKGDKGGDSKDDAAAADKEKDDEDKDEEDEDGEEGGGGEAQGAPASVSEAAAEGDDDDVAESWEAVDEVVLHLGKGKAEEEDLTAKDREAEEAKLAEAAEVALSLFVFSLFLPPRVSCHI